MLTPQARTMVARLTLAYKLVTIHKEAWLPIMAAVVGCLVTGPTPWLVAPLTFAGHLWWAWKAQGAYRRNAEDTMLARFHYRWALAAIDDPDNTPTLVAVHIERATRAEARALRKHQGRHALTARSMTLVVRPMPAQATAKDWVGKFQASKKAEYGFQTATDPRPAPLDNNALEFTFGQERLPTEVRAVVA